MLVMQFLRVFCPPGWWISGHQKYLAYNGYYRLSFVTPNTFFAIFSTKKPETRKSIPLSWRREALYKYADLSSPTTHHPLTYLPVFQAWPLNSMLMHRSHLRQMLEDCYHVSFERETM
jgi:hypothetical protein